MSGTNKYAKDGTEGMWNRALYRSYGDPERYARRQPGRVDFREGVVRPKHRAGEAFSSEEIGDMSDAQYRAVLADAAARQRGLPERRMHQIQKAHRGVYAFLAEHVGDISHRMGESFATEHSKSYDRHYPLEKVCKTSRAINHPYGFEREHAEQITENVDYNKADRSEYTQQLDAASEAYSQAHEALPVYNLPMSTARDTAVHLGRGQFDEVRKGLAKMEFITANQKRYNLAMGQSGAVRWLKGQGR